LKQTLKSVSTSEKTKIQTEIDEISSKITTNKQEIESMNTERESAITEETSARTELTYTSQSLKKVEVYEQHVSEQITVAEVVISSKKSKIEEESTKTTII
jgi:regulator of replication initiation timing